MKRLGADWAPGGCSLRCWARSWPSTGRRWGSLPWDDEAHVTRSSLRSLHGLGRIWPDVHASQQYYPLLHSAFWLEHWLWGDAPVGYHLLNVLLHATSAWLLVLILRRLAVPGALLAGCLFALHPVGVGMPGRRAEAARQLELYLQVRPANDLTRQILTQLQGN